jgi:hypothetical protein
VLFELCSTQQQEAEKTDKGIASQREVQNRGSEEQRFKRAKEKTTKRPLSLISIN